MTKSLLTTLGIILLLTACGAPAAPALPTVEATVPPPTATIPPPTATVVPSPTLNPLLFRDDFEGALGDGWHWLREKSRYWSLTANPGWLQIMARSGGLGDGTMSNVLLRDAPSGDFELQIGLKFRPTGNYQIAGLVVYQDTDNHMVFGRAFCNTGNCVGDGFYMDMIEGGNWNPENYATKAPATEVVHLRLRRVGDVFTGLVSEDGSKWTVMGSHRGVPNPLFVGILAGQARGSVPGPAQFDYFTIQSVP